MAPEQEQEQDKSGHNLDIWGGQVTGASYWPRPDSGDPCHLQVEGRCPPGCTACLEYDRSCDVARPQ